MAYTKQEWKAYPDTTTLITADRLNHIEDGIKTNTDIDSATNNPLTRTTDGLKVKVSADTGNQIQIKSDGMFVPQTGGSTVSVSAIETSGTHIADVTVNGTKTELYAPSGSSGSTVSVSQTLTSGTEIGGITVDGTETKLYAPSGGSGGGADASIYTSDGVKLGFTGSTFNTSCVVGSGLKGSPSLSAVFGSSNTVNGSCTLVGGTYNTVMGAYNVVGGASNVVAFSTGNSQSNIVSGQENVVQDCSSTLVVGNKLNAISRTECVRFGKYNEDDSNDMLQIGNGTSSSRKNIFTVTQDGDIHFCKADGTLVSLRSILSAAGLI